MFQRGTAASACSCERGSPVHPSPAPSPQHLPTNRQVGPELSQLGVKGRNWEEFGEWRFKASSFLPEHWVNTLIQSNRVERKAAASGSRWRASLTVRLTTDWELARSPQCNLKEEITNAAAGAVDERWGSADDPCSHGAIMHNGWADTAF